jgi:hypothetical protein
MPSPEDPAGSVAPRCGAARLDSDHGIYANSTSIDPASAYSSTLTRTHSARPGSGTRVIDTNPAGAKLPVRDTCSW